jgi:hypothetical protein
MPHRGNIQSRLGRLEEQGRGDACPECGLAPGEPRKMAVIYEEDPDKSFDGDPGERCTRCGRFLYTVLRVVYDSPADEEGGGGLLG